MMEHFQTVAEQVRAMCPDAGATATLAGDLTEADVVDLQLTCRTADGNASTPRIPGIAAYTISRALSEQRAAMAVPGQAPWSRCTFTLFPDGEFKFDVEYDN